MSLGDQVDGFLSEMHFLSPVFSLEGKRDVGSAYGSGCGACSAG